MDSSGLAPLITLPTYLAQRGHQLVISNPTPMARRLLQLDGRDAILRMEPTPYGREGGDSREDSPFEGWARIREPVPLFPAANDWVSPPQHERRTRDAGR